jgi:hypothetical protein
MSRRGVPQPLGIGHNVEALLIHRELECLRAEGARHRSRTRIARRRQKYLAVVHLDPRRTGG